MQVQSKNNQKGLQDLGINHWQGIMEQRLFSPLSFYLQAMTLEETDGPSLLTHGSIAGVATKILVLSDNGRAYHSTRHAGLFSVSETAWTLTSRWQWPKAQSPSRHQL